MGRFLDLIYLPLLVVVGPFWALARRLKGKRTAPLSRRLGGVEPRPGSRPAVWVHAVSVGEVLCARGLVERLVARGDRDVIVTATTSTGLETARRVLPGALIREAPLDLSFAIRRFLARVRPDLLILVELELWPNWMRVLGRRGLPIWVVNAKISERSARGYARLERWGLTMLGGLARVLAQEEAYAERFVAHGLPRDRVLATGNLKYANAASADPTEDRRKLRAEHGFRAGAPILVAGSTHPGEEAVVLDAFAALRAGDPDLRLVLAPRHPERAEEVGGLCRQSGWKVGWRRQPDAGGDPDVLVVDTLGELQRLYALADVTFVGGTLVPIGGHNLLEPAGWGLPVVTGTSLHTVREMADRLGAAGCHVVVEDADGLMAATRRFLDDQPARQAAAEGARRVLDEHRGALDRTLDALAPALEPAPLPSESAPNG